MNGRIILPNDLMQKSWKKIFASFKIYINYKLNKKVNL